MSSLMKKKTLAFKNNLKNKQNQKNRRECAVWSEKREGQLSAYLCTVSTGGATRTFVMKLRSTQ